MAKLTALGFLLAALFVAASAYKTTVTTVVIEDEDHLNRPHSGKCSEQIQRQQQLSQCQELIQQKSEKYIAMVGMRGADDDVHPQQVQQCCQQLKQVEEQCRCKGLEHIVEQQQQQGKLQGQQLKQMIQRAENIPSLCQMSPKSCQIRVSEVLY